MAGEGGARQKTERGSDAYTPDSRCAAQQLSTIGLLWHRYFLQWHHLVSPCASVYVTASGLRPEDPTLESM